MIPGTARKLSSRVKRDVSLRTERERGISVLILVKQSQDPSRRARLAQIGSRLARDDNLSRKAFGVASPQNAKTGCSGDPLKAVHFPKKISVSAS